MHRQWLLRDHLRLALSNYHVGQELVAVVLVNDDLGGCGQRADLYEKVIRVVLLVVV